MLNGSPVTHGQEPGSRTGRPPRTPIEDRRRNGEESSAVTTTTVIDHSDTSADPISIH